MRTALRDSFLGGQDTPARAEGWGGAGASLPLCQAQLTRSLSLRASPGTQPAERRAPVAGYTLHGAQLHSIQTKHWARGQRPQPLLHRKEVSAGPQRTLSCWETHLFLHRETYYLQE